MRSIVSCLVLVVLSCAVAQEQPWWKTSTFYQVYPRSLKDSNGDGVGDLKGITESIPHFLEAGVDCVWLSPIYKSPMKDFGYDISDYYQIDPIFGTWEDFEEMASAIKAAGLRLVMDFVPNHCSDQHEWFQKSLAREEPYTDYYVWHDSMGVDENGTQILPNNWVSAFAGPAWEWSEQRQQFYLHQFTIAQPEFNFRNPLVVEEMKAILRYWLENGVDGFRLDVPNHMVEHADFLDEPLTNDPNCPPMQFCTLEHIYTMNQPENLVILSQFRQVVDQYSIETGEVKVLMSEPTNNVEDTMSFYGNATHPLMDFPFNVDFIQMLNNESNARDVESIINLWLDNMPEGATANWVIGNHDQVRVGTRQGLEYGLATNMMTHLLPGVSVTYNGEEINMENTFVSWEDTQDPQGCNAGIEYYQRYSRDPQRTPFQWNDQPFAGFTSGSSTWLPVNENYLNLNLEAQKAAELSAFKVYKALTALRKNQVIKFGSLELHSISDDVIAFTRELDGEESVMVVTNTAYTPVVVSDLRTMFATLPDQGVAYTASLDSELQNGDIVDLSALPLPARGGIVLHFTPQSK